MEINLLHYIIKHYHNQGGSQKTGETKPHVKAGINSSQPAKVQIATYLLGPLLASQEENQSHSTVTVVLWSHYFKLGNFYFLYIHKRTHKLQKQLFQCLKTGFLCYMKQIVHFHF